MRITRLQLRDLGRHRDLDIEIAPGFTIIRGPNEAGKSTIQRGLELALFRRPTAATAELEALRSWGAADDSRPVYGSNSMWMMRRLRARSRSAAYWRRSSAARKAASRSTSAARSIPTRPESKSS